jgi:cell division cycle 14
MLKALSILAVSPNVYLSQNDKPELKSDDEVWFCGCELQYVGYCDDFGPMNASSVLQFIEMLDDLIQANPKKNLIYCAEEGKRHLTNAAFLLGAYAILARNETPEQVWERFSSLPPGTFEHYRDATFSRPTFRLSLFDCWNGLAQGKALGWIDAIRGKPGCIDKEEYDHYDNPLNGDLHVVVPGKFVAFRGPRDLPGGAEYRDCGECREFAPRYYIDIFNALGVRSVVRLNERQYDSSAFESSGIRHIELPFEDCTAPPNPVVAAFLRAADASDGLLAVHCKAGLGRTGTLIALYMMRHHGFTARAAMGWLRIMRPGSVIGEQQDYLCSVDRAVVSAARRPAGSFSARSIPALLLPLEPRLTRVASADSAILAQQVAAASRRRASTLLGLGR